MRDRGSLHTDDYRYRVGDWILIRFTSEESGRFRKLSRPWHGPFRVETCSDTNVTDIRVYFPFEEPVHVHQNRVKPCPEGFTPGYYWYGGRRCGPGRPPRWVEAVLAGEDTPNQNTHLQNRTVMWEPRRLTPNPQGRTSQHQTCLTHWKNQI